MTLLIKFEECSCVRKHAINFVCFPYILTREYAKRYERIIGDKGKFARSLAHSVVNCS